MISKYSVAFLIPKGAKRFLKEDGWEFECDTKIPDIVESLLKSKFTIVQSSPEFSAYENNDVKVDVYRGESGKIENVYFRFYNGVKPKLPMILKKSECVAKLDFFIPK